MVTGPYSAATRLIIIVAVSMIFFLNMWLLRT